MASSIPLIDLAGSAYECGRRYADTVQTRYPGFSEYLALAREWEVLPAATAKLFAAYAPHIPELYRGIAEADGPVPDKTPVADGCTSFSVSGALTADGHPLSGQNKDTPADRLGRYVVLRMRMENAPTILVLAYPGEVLGYGLWSTGVSLFRNNLYSLKGSDQGLSLVQWGLLALAGNTIEQGIALARERSITGSGNCLITDKTGASACIEFNRGGISVVEPEQGVLTHANHPVGVATAPFEQYPDKREQECSRFRAARLRQLLHANKGRMTVRNVWCGLGDHENQPYSICRHGESGSPDGLTTASVVADPAAGKLYVVKGNPCCNEPQAFIF